jgi:hypothetical protein
VPPRGAVGGWCLTLSTNRDGRIRHEGQKNIERMSRVSVAPTSLRAGIGVLLYQAGSSAIL